MCSHLTCALVHGESLINRTQQRLPTKELYCIVSHQATLFIAPRRGPLHASPCLHEAEDGCRASQREITPLRVRTSQYLSRSSSGQDTRQVIQSDESAYAPCIQYCNCSIRLAYTCGLHLLACQHILLRLFLKIQSEQAPTDGNSTSEVGSVDQKYHKGKS